MCHSLPPPPRFPKLIIHYISLGTRWKIALIWMPQNVTNDEPMSVHVNARPLPETNYLTQGLILWTISIVIHNRWNVYCALIHVVVMWSLRQYAYGTTAVLSWHVQYFAAQTILQRSYTETNFPSNLNYNGKIVWETGPRSMLPYGVTRPRISVMYWFIYTLLSYTLE